MKFYSQRVNAFVMNSHLHFSQRSILIELCSDVHYVNQRYTFVVIGREIVWETKKKRGGGLC